MLRTMAGAERYSAFSECFDMAVELLSGGVVDLQMFGLKLVKKNFLDRTALSAILSRDRGDADKARMLLMAVGTQIQHCEEPTILFERFLDILRIYPSLEGLLDSIIKRLKKVRILIENVRARAFLTYPSVFCHLMHVLY